MKLAFLLIAACAASAVAAAQEELRYTVNWPSGLSLGEAQMTAQKKGDFWQFEFGVEAAVPGFQVNDRYRSSTFSGLLCSQEFEKDVAHGKRKTKEKMTFEGQRGMAVRETVPGGGKSEIEIGACARDALAFVQFVRRELAQGRIPSPQNIYFGAPYRVRLEYSGTQAVRIADKNVDADRIIASLKGPKSEITVEIFFARDAVRTPVRVKVPLALGTFTMDLAP